MSKMLCGFCVTTKEYPDDFPVLGYAKCAACYRAERLGVRPWMIEGSRPFRAMLWGVWRFFRRALRLGS